MKNINQVKELLEKELPQATATDKLAALESLFKKEIKELYQEMKDLSVDEKKSLGAEINSMRTAIEAQIADRKKALTAGGDNEKYVDLTIPTSSFIRGKIHPLVKVGNMLEKAYKEMGFSIVYGPEIEGDKYNYEMLNMPYYHPARDMQDTFYLKYPEVLLRSHTSCVQIRHMLTTKPPFMIISPGVVYRVDEIDPQHTPCFFQVEGLVVGEGINLANLKWSLIEIVKRVFGEQYNVKFTPCYYPYTEPSAAVDMQCIMCSGKGCRTCKGSGWMRVCGCGMVHPNVFEGVGYPRDTQGFAFGWGLNKFPMLYYKIAEMRKFFENELSLWKQL